MNNIKNELYSRQIGSIGIGTNQKLNNLNILIIGLDLLGIELCKCVTLMGIGNIYVYDPRKYSVDKDLFFLKIPKNNIKDLSTVPYLQSLNRYINIKAIRNEEISSLNLDIIIQTDLDLTLPILKENLSKSSIYLNDFCRKKNIRYILGLTVGFTGYIFQDLIKHTIINDNGEKPKTSVVFKITEDNNNSILQIEKKHPFCIGEKIKINDNEHNIFTIINIDNCIIKLDKNVNISSKCQNITITEIKNIQNIDYQCLSSRLNYPPDVTINISNNEHSKSLKKDIEKILIQPKNFHNEEFQFDKIINNFRFPVLDSIIASIISQEIVKITGTFTPLHQELLIDYSEFYNKNDLYTNNLYKNKKKNFENLYGLFSKQMIKELKNIRFFVIGCGALGCEYLKLLSLLDCATDKGSIDVIDMDNIELSNLNRQFLFSESDIGLYKSEIAVQKIKSMKSNISIFSHNEKLDSNNEDKFSRTFWNDRDIIINALDNVEARKYVDSQCVLYDKPLFEAGTLGTKCNLQIIKPYETACYSESIDPINEEIPYCTVRYFPSKIEHCIEWSLEVFNKYFSELMIITKKLVNNKNEFFDHINSIDNDFIKLNILRNTIYLTDFLEKENIDLLHKFMKYIYIQLFIIPIHSLTKSFPHDFKIDDDNYFWVGDKIYPNTINHDEHYNLFASSFYEMIKNSINITTNFKPNQLKTDEIELVLSEPDTIQQLSIHKNKKIHHETCNYTDKIEYYQCLINKKTIKKYDIVQQKINDTDSNHITFIQNITNTRASIYSIKNINYLECKIMSCKITPALSSTTNLITALSMMEILKYIYNKVNKNLISTKKLKNYDYFINTGINLYLQSIPQKPKKKINDTYNSDYGCIIKTPDSFLTYWDKHIIPKKIITIENLIKYLTKKYDIDILNITVKDKMYFSKDGYNNLEFQILNIFTENNIFSENYIQFDIFGIKDNNIMILPKLVFTRYQ